MEHGTRSMYVSAKCRCPDCTAANTAYNRTRQQGDVLTTHIYGKRARDKRRALLNEYKSGGCVRCGYNESPVALDFHHLGGKEIRIGSQMCISLDRLLEELKKCVVLCANCHRLEHFAEEE